MIYDILHGGYEEYEDEPNKPFTIGKLLDVLDNTSATCVQLIGTTYTLGSLMSWRGSYDTPAFDYEEGYKSPREIADEIRSSLKEVHYGYKGGAYAYNKNDEFYIAPYGSMGGEHMIVETKNDGGTLLLCTKIIPY